MGSAIRLVAILASIFVLLGFAFFAVDEMDKGSKTQQQALAASWARESRHHPDRAHTRRGERARGGQHGLRARSIDDVNDVLLAPFAA